MLASQLLFFDNEAIVKERRKLHFMKEMFKQSDDMILDMMKKIAEQYKKHPELFADLEE